MEKKERKGINGNTLKIIAVLTMIIDHVGASVLWEYIATLQGDSKENWYAVYLVMRYIGRMAFPIYCFFIVEGIEKTRNVKKYITRLFLFALISEIPFDYALMGKLTLGYQNVFFTLLIGLLCIWGLKETEEKIPIMKKQIPLKIIIIFAAAMLANVIKTDYSGFGVIVIAFLYLLRKQRSEQCIFGAVAFCEKFTSILSFVLLYFYNGKRGRNINKYFFYAVYPVHLAILAVVKMICFG